MDLLWSACCRQCAPYTRVDLCGYLQWAGAPVWTKCSCSGSGAKPVMLLGDGAVGTSRCG